MKGHRPVWFLCHVIFVSLCYHMISLQIPKAAGINNLAKHSHLFWTEAIISGHHGAN